MNRLPEMNRMLRIATRIRKLAVDLRSITLTLDVSWRWPAENLEHAADLIEEGLLIELAPASADDVRGLPEQLHRAGLEWIEEERAEAEQRAATPGRAAALKVRRAKVRSWKAAMRKAKAKRKPE